ncbi:unnamed protein product [Polarella glacialis]|uniref:Uncharacterized protein n=1 Tax=Polarella glacialis TaxID=89957 RepID=A0A813DS46_POLGL|nr:unnamed protein product [Polarella glacialis]CAE8666664.1 unnamed protein product [Polarella glacialis]|mmetsp:Transcript_45066/g.81549  ORF Transcript_45066/g.81549 Transcript_45066/m.81549 type:complete len:157 (+) Transcript_45066:77-547(+)
MPIYGASGIQGARMHRSHIGCLSSYASWEPPVCPPPLVLSSSRATAVSDKVSLSQKVNGIVASALDDAGGPTAEHVASCFHSTAASTVGTLSSQEYGGFARKLLQLPEKSPRDNSFNWSVSTASSSRFQEKKGFHQASNAFSLTARVPPRLTPRIL